MKAIVTTGRTGYQFKPSSLELPKSMLSLFGRPILEHMLLLLRKHGITQVCVALYDLPQAVITHFGNGSRLGMSLTYLSESPLLGAVGDLGFFQKWLGNETLLVINGDIICDFDLSRAAEFHFKHSADATILLTHANTLQARSLVTTDEHGRIIRFHEKPFWGQTDTNQVNTEIYMLSETMLHRISYRQQFDCLTDLFPSMLDTGKNLYGCSVNGYWNSLETWESYLQCVTDALSGKLKLELDSIQQSPGIWSLRPIPKDVTLIPPCWLGDQVVLGTGCLIGPYTLLESNTEIGSRALIQRSVLLSGAKAGRRSTLHGTILCPNSAAEQDTILHEGVVLGDGATAKERSVLLDGVRIWNGLIAPAGSRLSCSLANQAQSSLLSFSDSGIIQGRLGENIGPEGLVAIGSVLGTMESVALGHWGGMGARMLAQAAASGAAATGAAVLTHDLECAAQSAWLAQRHQFPISLFIQQEGDRIFLHFFGKDGLPLGRFYEQKLEQALRLREFPRVSARRMGETEHLSVTSASYCVDAVHRARLGKGSLRTLTAAVPGDRPEERSLRRCLELLGCTVTDYWHRGIPAFGAEHGGAFLTAQDERGILLEPEQLLPVLCLIEMENGSGQVAVPDGASAACDLVAAGFSGQCFRIGRDGASAKNLYASQPWLWDAAFAAVRIMSRMSLTGESLEHLVAKTPRFSIRKREVHLKEDRNRVMAELAQEHNLNSDGDGLRIRTGNGWVYLVPLIRRPSVRVLAESPDIELAAELCDLYAGRVLRAERRIKS